MFVSLNSWDEPGTILQGGEPEEMVEGGPGDWAKLANLLARRKNTKARDAAHPTSGAMGFFTYEGAFRFGWFPKIMQVREGAGSAAWEKEKGLRTLSLRVGDVLQWSLGTRENNSPALWTPNQSRTDFEARVARAQEYIAAGDIYQVNLAQRFSTRFEGSSYRLFEHLLARSPAPGAAFLDFGNEQILSASPELFLKIRGRHVTTRPIKGTRPRSRDLLRDEQLAYELQTDPKELAELVMITDLERNDLGQICEYGSVEVTRLLQLERYAQVFHLVSTVEGLLRPEVSALEALRACFPGGSISGAPKKRACEIIAELEPCPRGVYTGAIGYFADNGEAAFSIAIRTMVRQGNELSFFVGSGITAGSVPAQEYEETLHKAAGMRQALEAYGEREKVEVRR